MTTPLPLLYGIPNCSTVKRARAWLEDRGIEHRFIDLKKGAIEPAVLAHWVEMLGWEAVLNRQGTTWRKLDDETRASTVDSSSAVAAMLAHPTLVKRPVVEWPSGEVTAGFTAELFKQQSDVLATTW
jgi:arsenate reductase (glutaredoxin)